MLVAGVDSSTQSTKVLLCEAEDGAIVAQASAPHPDGTECPPQAWWEALTMAGDGLLARAAAVGVAGEQEGMGVLDENAEVIRPALLWNDLRSAAAAQALVEERGPRWWAECTGSVPNASFTVTKLRWLAEHEPDHAARTHAVMLPHDYLTWRLLAGPPLAKEPVTDRGDASGTGYFSPAGSAWLSARALAAAPGAGGITLLPYFDGERTPVRPGATGTLHGLTTRNATPENLARAAVESVLASLAEVASLLHGDGDGAQPSKVLLI